MQGELFYGNDGLLSRNDVHASGNSSTSTFGPQEACEVTEEKESLAINNSNSRLDKYLFYFSSRL